MVCPQNRATRHRARLSQLANYNCPARVDRNRSRCPAEVRLQRSRPGRLEAISRIQLPAPQPSPKPTPLPSLAFHVHLSDAGEITRCGPFSFGEKVRMRELFLTSVRAGLAFTERPIHLAWVSRDSRSSCGSRRF